MNDDQCGRRDEHLRHLYAKQKLPGESFEAFVARTTGDEARNADKGDDAGQMGSEDGTH